jgi:hypothetical protein
LVLVGTSARFP